MHPFRPARPVLLAFTLLALAGCGEPDDIRTYDAPRVTEAPIEAKVRLLAAIFDRPPNQWYFKLVGPTDEITKHEAAFNAFIQSVRFTDDKANPVTWNPPAAWGKGPSNKLRYATFYLGQKGKAPELTVFQFDRVTSVLDNVQRWCETDLGRRPVREPELDQFTRKVKVGPHAAVLVDITGPGVRPGKRPPMGAMKAPRPLEIAYDVPKGWTETGPRVSRRGPIAVSIYTAFDVGAGKKAETTVQRFPRQFGDWTENVNRWRGKVGLPDLSDAEANQLKDRTLTADGVRGPYLDMTGPEQRSLIVVLARGNRTWFFNLFGDKNVVADNKGKFESFVQSVKFTGAADE